MWGRLTAAQRRENPSAPGSFSRFSPVSLGQVAAVGFIVPHRLWSMLVLDAPAASDVQTHRDPAVSPALLVRLQQSRRDVAA